MTFTDAYSQMVTELEAMMIERLKVFNGRNKRYPERILVYRDGVSEVTLYSF